MKSKSSERENFDCSAIDYHAAWEKGLSVTGENKGYFVEGRVTWLKARLNQLGEQPASVLDFGCGDGDTSELLIGCLGATVATGIDPSIEMITQARKQHASERCRFMYTGEFQPDANVDLVYSNGVFHHISVETRLEAVQYVNRCLRPGGIFALWENNPWNPATRYVMSRIPFDRDAITLSAPETRGLLRAGGFDILQTDFLFLFPKMFSWLRGIEPLFSGVPIGAQYLVLARKPDLSP